MATQVLVPICAAFKALLGEFCSEWFSAFGAWLGVMSSIRMKSPNFRPPHWATGCGLCKFYSLHKAGVTHPIIVITGDVSKHRDEVATPLTIDATYWPCVLPESINFLASVWSNVHLTKVYKQ